MLMQTYASAFTVDFGFYCSLSDGELLAKIAHTWNSHCTDFAIREEEDRFMSIFDLCGSGSRMLRGQMWRDMFHYGEPLSAKMAGPHPINFQRQDAPTYCTHCAASNRAQLFIGEPLFFVVNGHAQLKVGQPCRQFSFKKTARGQAPQELRAQIGLASVTERA